MDFKWIKVPPFGFITTSIYTSLVIQFITHSAQLARLIKYEDIAFSAAEIRLNLKVFLYIF